MSGFDFTRIKSIFLDVVDLPATQRTAILDQACAGDKELRAYVEDLLKQDDSNIDIVSAEIKDYLGANGEAGDVDGVDPWTGRQLGPYALRERIGRGGMGDVYRAVRTSDFESEVAVKLASRASFSQDFARRFRDEIQFQAALSRHPHIATLRDAGQTEEGIPYFVMDYVNGDRIDKYCDAQKLDARARIDLFRQVCDAVQTAHQNAVIHRDLKPSNILVTKQGVPMLIDFGIAKFSADGEMPGQSTAGSAFTPAYASPEQIRRHPITTATDIYSLGVVLYELLSGHHPQWSGNDMAAAIHQIVDELPPRPSEAVSQMETIVRGELETVKVTPDSVCLTRRTTPSRLRRMLQGDLDTIVMKALQKDPARRYTTAEQFSDDLRRYQEGLPIRARPDHWAYRTRKFIRRNRVAVFIATLLAASLVAGAIGTGVFAVRAERQRQLAQSRFEDVRELANKLLVQVYSAIRDLPGATPAVKQLVDTSLDYLRRLESSTELQPQDPLWIQLADAYIRLGDIQGLPGQSNLGDLDGGVASYDHGRQMMDALLIVDPDHPRAPLLRSAAMRGISAIHLHRGEIDQAIEVLEETLRQLQPSHPSRATDAEFIIELHSVHYRLIDSYIRGGNWARARDHIERAIEVVEPLATSSSSALLRSSLAIALVRKGQWQVQDGDYDGALTTSLRAQQLLKELTAESPGDARQRRTLAIANDQLARLYLQREELALAVGLYQANEDLFQALSAADPSNVQHRRDMVIASARVGDVFIEQALPQKAVTHYETSAKFGKAVWELTGAFQDRRQYVMSIERVARAFAELEQFEDAIRMQRQVVALRQELVADQPGIQPVQQELGFAWDRLGAMLLQAKLPDDALAPFEEALHHRRKLYQATPENTDQVRQLADNLISLGEVRIQLDQREDAAQHAREGIDLRRKLAQQFADDADLQSGFASAAFRVGQILEGSADGAHVLLAEAHAFYDEGLSTLKALAESGTLSLDDQAQFADLKAACERVTP